MNAHCLRDFTTDTSVPLISCRRIGQMSQQLKAKCKEKIDERRILAYLCINNKKKNYHQTKIVTAHCDYFCHFEHFIATENGVPKSFCRKSGHVSQQLKAKCAEKVDEGKNLAYLCIEHLQKVITIN